MEMFEEGGYALPQKFSDLLRVALAALERFEKDPRYTISMLNWHSPEEGPEGKCGVCLAGVVMAATFRVPPTSHREPQDYPPRIRQRLQALSASAFGVVEDVGITNIVTPPEVNESFVSYSIDPIAFKVWLQKLSFFLESQEY